VDAPKQIVVGDADAITFGKLFTVIVTLDVLLQPLAFVAVTVYVVVAVGETVGEPVKLPGTHEYVVPPVALNTLEPPKQIALGEAVATTFKTLLTDIVTALVLLHPLALVAVTVYVVVAAGETVGDPVKLPGNHEYVLPPVALNTLEPPTQIDDGEAEADTLGRLFTVTDSVVVLVQPFALVAVTV
jgi:hypothetical protein